MIDSRLWESGYTLEAYVNHITHYKKEMQERLKDLRITPSECQKLKLFSPRRNILVLTESWCPDSLMNLPVLAKIVECAPSLTLRIFLRDENPQLGEFFINQGITRIPVFWLMDEEFTPLGYWMERPKNAYKKVAGWKQENPELEQLKQDQTLDEDTRRMKLKGVVARYVDEMWNWYDTGLQSDTLTEIAEILWNSVNNQK